MSSCTDAYVYCPWSGQNYVAMPVASGMACYNGLYVSASSPVCTPCTKGSSVPLSFSVLGTDSNSAGGASSSNGNSESSAPVGSLSGGAAAGVAVACAAVAAVVALVALVVLRRSAPRASKAAPPSPKSSDIAVDAESAAAPVSMEVDVSALKLEA